MELILTKFIGHMALIAELEDAFEISMEMDDIIDFSSYCWN